MEWGGNSRNPEFSHHDRGGVDDCGGDSPVDRHPFLAFARQVGDSAQNGPPPPKIRLFSFLWAPLTNAELLSGNGCGGRRHRNSAQCFG